MEEVEKALDDYLEYCSKIFGTYRATIPESKYLVLSISALVEGFIEANKAAETAKRPFWIDDRTAKTLVLVENSVNELKKQLGDSPQFKIANAIRMQNL